MLEERTDTIVRHEGMNILIKHLGPVDAERFIALMNREPFDYTEWRRNPRRFAVLLTAFWMPESIVLITSNVGSNGLLFSPAISEKI